MSIINPFPKPPPPVEFTALLSTNMDQLLLHALPTGFISTLRDDRIIVDFGSGDASRLFGEFDYSSPLDLPMGGELTRLQETDGGALQFEARYLSMPILDVLSLAGNNTSLLLSNLFDESDKFTGSNFDDLLRAYAGDDIMKGGAGNDSLFGGEGADTIEGGDGRSYLRGEDGADILVGGNDFDDMNGNQGDDTLHGGVGGDWVVGGKGDDQLYGDDSDDLVLGNLGWDSLSGGTGNDTLRGGQDNDLLQGGDGNDWLSGDRGFDVLYGGRGADTFFFFPGAELDRILDFNAAEGDRIQLQLGTIYTVEQIGADVLVRSGALDQLVLVGVRLSDLPAGWLFEG